MENQIHKFTNTKIDSISLLKTELISIKVIKIQS